MKKKIYVVKIKKKGTLCSLTNMIADFAVHHKTMYVLE